MTAAAAPTAAPDDASRFPLGPALAVMASLSAIAASTSIAVAELALGRNASQFFEYNNTRRETRTAVLVAVLLSIALPALFALPKLVRHRARGVEELTSLAKLLSPLLIGWAIPPLFGRDLPEQRPLGFLVLLTAVTFALQFLLRLSFESVPAAWRKPRPVVYGARAALRRYGPFAVVCAAVTGYVAFMTYYTILEHHRFQTAGYDLGIYTSLIRNFMAGYFYRAPILSPDVSYLAHHAEFGPLYLLPVYALFPRAETLLTIQALFVGAAAIPLYLFARTQIPRGPSLALALAYLLFAPIQGAVFYDFHWMPMTMPVWFTLFYGLATRRRGIIIAAVMLVLPMREETGLMLGAVGLLIFASGYWPALGLVFGAVGVGWFFLMRAVLIPMHGDANFAGYYKDLVVPGEHGFPAFAKTLLSNPNFVWTTLAVEPKLKYFLHLLGPFAFVPLRRAPLLPLLLPAALCTLLTTYEPTITISFQYVTHWVPWLFAITVLVIRGYGTLGDAHARQRAVAYAVFFGILCHSVAFGAFFGSDLFRGGWHRVAFGITDAEKQRYQSFRTVVAEIPKDARVAASDSQSPHLGDFVDACSLRISHCDAEYLLIARQSFSSDDRRNVNSVLQHEDYGLVRELGSIYLFKRRHQSPGTAKAWRELGITPPGGAH